MHFRPASQLRDVARATLERERARIGPLVPGGDLVLTGASSMPDLLTAGDIDLHLRVPAAEFDLAIERLRGVYAVVLPGIWRDGFATFAVPDADPPIGVALTAIDGEHDRRFRRSWARLAADESARMAYNAIKRAHEGRPESDYLAAKSQFFDALAAEAEAD